MKQYWTVVLASLVATLVAGVSAESAFAAPNTQSPRAACEAAGHAWSPTKGCANKTCKSNGKSYDPGSVRTGPPILGTKRNTYWCDGFTGSWTRI